jgi:Tfp pilus assembly protein PilX
MEERSFEGRRGERGFALVLAILSLMLLTFLGLTMATTTSTELQIATNYRWSQQAVYNAEAGLEAARIVLSDVSDTSSQWVGALPPARTSWWDPAPPTGAAGPITGRDYERWECDERGAGVGYGTVLTDTSQRYENVTTFAGENLNGAFTVWIRRPLMQNNAGQYSEDSSDNSRLIIVAEGVAPYTGTGDAFTRARQAVRVLETRYSLALGTAGEPCGLGRQQGQEGGSPMGENYNPCVNITPGAGGTLGPVFGGGEAGGLTVK